MKIPTSRMYRKEIERQRAISRDSMIAGNKRPSRKASEWFRRPAYSVGFASDGKSGGEKDAD